MPRRNIALGRVTGLMLGVINDTEPELGFTASEGLKNLQKRWAENRALVKSAGARIRRLYPEKRERVRQMLESLELNEALENAPGARVPVTPARTKEYRVPQRRSIRPFQTK